jgi:DNA repair protein RadC
MDKSYQGHRQRLRERFYKGGLDGFHDYEVVEMLLTLSSPRGDCKPPAKAAIKRFQDLRGVLEAASESFRKSRVSARRGPLPSSWCTKWPAASSRNGLSTARP